MGFQSKHLTLFHSFRKYQLSRRTILLRSLLFLPLSSFLNFKLIYCQLGFSNNYKANIPQIFQIKKCLWKFFQTFFARPLGLEPRTTVLETVMLPLHYGHVKPTCQRTWGQGWNRTNSDGFAIHPASKTNSTKIKKGPLLEAPLKVECFTNYQTWASASGYQKFLGQMCWLRSCMILTLFEDYISVDLFCFNWITKFSIHDATE